MVARFVRDEEAVGSNPATPTTRSAGQCRFPGWEAGPDAVLGDLLGEIWEKILKILSRAPNALPAGTQQSVKSGDG